MSNSTFRFQQFSVQQQHSGMKICTDAILFAAMVPVKSSDKVLDIGAGTGVLSLMMAQRGAAQVTAVEITPEACKEARVNFQRSPWSDRLTVINQPIQDFALTATQRFDLIICNPPFFEDHSKASDALRRIARHTDQLSFTDLLQIASHLLSSHGLFYVLTPKFAVTKLIEIGYDNGIYLQQQTNFQAYEYSPAKVSALVFSQDQISTHIEQLLVIYDQPGIYSQQSQDFLQNFLLRFAEIPLDSAQG